MCFLIKKYVLTLEQISPFAADFLGRFCKAVTRLASVCNGKQLQLLLDWFEYRRRYCFDARWATFSGVFEFHKLPRLGAIYGIQRLHSWISSWMVCWDVLRSCGVEEPLAILKYSMMYCWMYCLSNCIRNYLHLASQCCCSLVAQYMEFCNTAVYKYFHVFYVLLRTLDI